MHHGLITIAESPRRINADSRPNSHPAATVCWHIAKQLC
jgi:hypothetical protein